MADFDKFHVYCDESGTSERFTVIGLIFCRDNVAAPFERWLEKISSEHQASEHEVKWTKLKKHNVILYKKYLDAFCAARRKGYAQFFAIIVDNSQMNHRLYNEGDKEIGFNKMLFQLLYSLIRKFRSRPRIYAYLDERTTKHTPDRLRTMLNAKARRDLKIVHNPYRVCQFRYSHEVRLIQLADLICGAIHYKINRKDHAGDAAAHKIEVVEYLTNAVGLHTLAAPTPWPADGFDLWHIDLTARAKGVPRT